MAKNILWIMADHFRGDCLSAAGHPVVKTPCLDALCRDGVRFANASTVSPLCCPSRASFFTSRYVHAHDTWWNGIPLRPGLAVLPEHLRARGYRTGLVGKLHFYPHSPEIDNGFDATEKHEECMPDELSAYLRFLRQRGAADKTARDCTVWDRNGFSVAAELGICHIPEELEETRWVADRAEHHLRAYSGSERPFFLFASFIRPHSPYNPLPRFYEMYGDVNIDAPPFDSDEWDRLPPRVRAQAMAHGWDTLTDADRVEVRRRYYALVSMVDESVGRILNSLAETGLAENTIVVFTADHGDFVGEHGCNHKMHLWEGALHIPLIICDPAGPRGGVSTALVESIDLMPTLLERVGVDIPDTVQGRSFSECIDDPERAHRDAVFAEYGYHSIAREAAKIYAACKDLHSVSVRTPRWKYIHYAGEDGELYDLARDPLERRNLVASPGSAPRLAELQRRLLDWRVSAKGAGYPAPEADNPYFRNLTKTSGR